MKILFSWLAVNNDINRDDNGKFIGINHDGPNFNMHKYFYNPDDEKEYDKHILLYSDKRNEQGAIRVKNDIQKEFTGHKVEIWNMEIRDVIDITEIKPKIEALLMEYDNDEIDLFVSPGTPAMTVAWYICHTTLGLKTRLLQLRPSSKTKSGKPELLDINIEKSETPYTSIVKEKNLHERDKRDPDYLITDTIKPIYKKAELIAETDRVTVLINGETGTGKEHLAKYIHDNSIRKNKPYVTINCSAFNDQLLESRLFGYKKGAFTGADKDTEGLFRQADGGTIFLDEIGDISSYMQQALLRVIQEKEIQPIGGKTQKVDVRIISATNKDLVKLCKEGKFRWDLYFRLVVAELEMPTLIERGPHEIEEMLNHFLKTKRKELRKPDIHKIGREAKQFLRNYTWPGNVRELENLVETLYVYCKDTVTPNDIPKRFKEIPEEASLLWKDAEKKHIEKVLKIKKGNQRQAQFALGYKAINTLRKKIKEYNIEVEMLK